MVARGRERKGTLYALVDVPGDRGDVLAEQIRQNLAAVFYRDAAGSVTASLLRAIREVNEALCAENERSIRTQREYAGLVAAIVRDADVYFAIVGPGRAYLLSDGATERVGGTAEPGKGHRLGEADEVGIEMYHRHWDAATTLILAGGGLPTLLDRALEQVPEIPPERALPFLHLLGERGGIPFRALAIAPGESAEAISTEVEARPAPPLVRPARQPQTPSAHARWLNALLARPLRRVARPEDPFFEESPPFDAPPVALSRLDDPEEAEDEEEPETEPGRPRLSLPALPQHTFLGLALVGIFVLGYFFARIPVELVQRGAAYANTVARLAAAEQEEKTALQQTDPLAKRQHLDVARRRAIEAQTLDPSNHAVATAVARIQQEYQTATGTVALPPPFRLLNLPDPADQLLLHGLDLYVLNRQASRVDKYLLNADRTAVLPHPNATLMRKGDRIGGVTVGDLTALAWIPKGGTRTADTLVVLDRAGFLIQYDAVRGLSTLALRDPASWDHVTALSGFAGNLFALNPTSQTLAWYPPQPDGYNGAAYNYFAPTTKVDLADAAGVLAGKDLYLVHLSGQIQKFVGGKPVAFGGPPPDLWPAHPAGLAVGGGSVFVGDPQRAQIVQLTESGTYQRTLGGNASAAVLGSMRDLTVSEDGRALYVLADHAVYRFDLPQAH